MKNKLLAKVWNSNFTMAVTINIMLFLLAVFLCDLKYEVSDDFVMASIMSGAYGSTQNPHMIYVNSILGYVLLPFYKIFPGISWYFIMHLFLCFISFTIITYFLLAELDRRSAIILSLLFLTFFSDDAYILVQFTKTAMLATMAGAVLFLRGVFRTRKRREIIIGSILCICGTMIRFQTIYIAGTFILFILIIEFSRLLKTKKYFTDLKYIFIQICLPGLVLIGIVFGMEEVDQKIYMNEEYAYFNEYNSARGKIVDFTDYGYEAYRTELEKIGISETDYYMMRNWNFADNEYFTADKMNEVAEVIQNKQKNETIDFERILENIQNRNVMAYPVCLACIIALIFSVIWNTEKWMYAVGAIGVGIFILTILEIRGKAVYRVEYAIFLGTFLCMLYFWQNESWKMRGDIKKISLILICLMCIRKIPLYIPDNTYKKVTVDERKQYVDNTFLWSGTYGATKYRKVVNKNVPKNGLLREFEENPDNFYFLDFNTTIQSLYYDINPFKALPVKYFNNWTFLGGIITNFPEVLENLESRELYNPMQDLIKENVYLVDNSGLELKLNYLREHYYPEVKAELYKEIEGYQIWKVYNE